MAGFVPISSINGSSNGSSPNVTITASGGLSVPGGAVEGLVVNLSLKDQYGGVKASWQHVLTPFDIGHLSFTSSLSGQSITTGTYSLYASVASGSQSETTGPCVIAVGGVG